MQHRFTEGGGNSFHDWTSLTLIRICRVHVDPGTPSLQHLIKVGTIERPNAYIYTMRILASHTCRPPPTWGWSGPHISKNIGFSIFAWGLNKSCVLSYWQRRRLRPITFCILCVLSSCHEVSDSWLLPWGETKSKQKVMTELWIFPYISAFFLKAPE